MARKASARPLGRFKNRHSDRVARLKVILPLTALAILSTLFLLADRHDRERVIRYSAAGYEETAQAGRVGRPDYSGIGSDGAEIFVTAEEAWPGRTDGEVTASSLTSTWKGRESGRVVASSASGVIGPERSRAELTGAVDIETDGGYRLRSERMNIDMDAGRMVSPGPVTGTGPDFRIDAGAMQVRQTESQALVTFTDGVKVIYDPKASEKDRQ